jgi:methyl-accepting chemotaxis protein
MDKSLSLKNKLALLASISIVIGCLIVETISFKSSLDNLNGSVEQRLDSSLIAYNGYVLEWFSAKERSLTSMQEDSNLDSLSNHLKQMKLAGDFDNVFLAYPDGSQKNANSVILPPGNDDPRKWGWYINAIADPSKVFRDNPTTAVATGALVVSLGKAVQLNGQQVVLGADAKINEILSIMERVILLLPGSGSIFIVNDAGNIFAHTNTDLLNKKVSTLGVNYSDIVKLARTEHDEIIDLNGEEYILYSKAIGGSGLTTVALINYDSVVNPVYKTLYHQLIFTAVFVIIGIVIFNFLCSLLFKPLRNVADALEQISSGSGDLTQRIPVESNDEVGRLANGFNDFVVSLQGLILHIRNQAEVLTGQSNTSASRANLTSDELSRQQQEINMVATAVTEMTSATQDIASHAEQTAQAVQESAENTSNGLQVVLSTKNSITRLAGELSEASEVVSELNQHALEISTVLGTIQGIAEQTNLLALNAAIEAARAGEQGRGFAVVADEVRVLSQRTHSSTEEIKSTIETLQAITDRAVGIMQNSSELANSSVDDADKASHALEEINSTAIVIRDMATQIATAAEEQSHVTNEITENVTSIRDVTKELVVGASESLQQANALKNEAADLSAKVATFKLS